MCALTDHPEAEFVGSAMALPRNYTTLLCGGCADGTMLDAVINWKSTAHVTSINRKSNRVTIKVLNSEISPINEGAPQVRQFVQSDTSEDGGSEEHSDSDSDDDL